MARLDALNANAQPEPPDRELAQVEERVGKRRARHYRCDVGRQAALLKKPFKHGKA